MPININTKQRKKFVSELSPVVNQLETVDIVLGIQCAKLIEAISKSIHQQRNTG